MRAFYLLLIISASCNFLHAQDRSGITGIPDTSYSISNEYKKHHKKYPAIEVAGVVSSGNIIEKKDITWTKTGERKLKLDIFYPKQKQATRRTAVIIIHGGGWRSGNRFMHHALAQKLSMLGYVCITPEYRLSTEALYPAAVHDIKSVIRWARKNAAKYNIDTSRIVVAGHSAGGQLAALTGTTNDRKEFEGDLSPTKFSSDANAVIDIDGTLSFVHAQSSEMGDPGKKGASAQWMGYTPAENMAIYKEASPLTHAGPRSVPFLFINSSLERMHAGRDDLVSILDKHKIYHEVKTFEDSPHTFCFFHPWFQPMVNCIDDFLKKIFPAK